ncbi:MAG TPA: GNAT family N-acetyltransferase, partial [Candidatus Binatia bacterium]|nr:GNAT family N-acetyltransferase [Candidatus Binatia bacterium]
MTTEPMTDSSETIDRTDAPGGLELRPFQGEPDLAAMIRVFNAANVEDRIDERLSVEAMRNWVEHPSPHFDPAGDIVLAVADGEVAGYGWTSWVDTTDGLREYATRGHVHPAWRRRRVGSALLCHNEARLRRLAAGHDTERPRTYAAYAPERRPGAVALLLGTGYQPVRYFFDMVRPTLEDIAVPALPDGLEIRP